MKHILHVMAIFNMKIKEFENDRKRVKANT